jgi:hypothetical protein
MAVKFKMGIRRRSGRSKGKVDVYYFTPMNRHRIRSLLEVKSCIALIDVYEDEEVACGRNKHICRHPLQCKNIFAVTREYSEAPT